MQLLFEKKSYEQDIEWHTNTRSFYGNLKNLGVPVDIVGSEINTSCSLVDCSMFR